MLAARSASAAVAVLAGVRQPEALIWSVRATQSSSSVACDTDAQEVERTGTRRQAGNGAGVRTGEQERQQPSQPTAKPALRSACCSECSLVPPCCVILLLRRFPPATARAVSHRMAESAADALVTHAVIDRVHALSSASSSASDSASVDGTRSFFVLQSSTSLYAGVPGHSGRADGDPLASTFFTPCDIAIDARQQLFVADTNNARIRRIAKNGGRVSTVASISGGDGPVENRPTGLAFASDGSLFILQGGVHHSVFVISPEGKVSQLAGSDQIGHTDSTAGGPSGLFKASFNFPRATAVDSKGVVYIVERGNNCVRRLDLQAKTVTTLLDSEGVPLDLQAPEGITVDQFDDIYVADTGRHRILKISPQRLEGHTTENPAAEPKTIYVTTNYAGRYGVAGYANGESADALLSSPTGLAIDKQNHLWICDSGNRCVRMFSYRSEMMFTVSGKGSPSQEALYVKPTSVVLSYDAQYGAEMAATTPDAVANDPNHPLYYSYITPVAFVADADAHCIRRIHTIMLEPANALIDVCNNDDTENDFPLHHALVFPDCARRAELVRVLLKLRPQLVHSRDKTGRLPIHVACMESSTLTAGSIPFDLIERLIVEGGSDSGSAESSLAVADCEGCTPLFYALQQMSLHAFNESEAGGFAVAFIQPDPETLPLEDRATSAAVLYSRALIQLLLERAPLAFTHPSCIPYTLHWLIFHGFGLPTLKRFVSGFETARATPGSGMGSLSSPFLTCDQNGRLPLHVAAMCAMPSLEVIQWLVESGGVAPRRTSRAQDGQTRGRASSSAVQAEDGSGVLSRDASILHEARASNPRASPADVGGIVGHYPLFYACTAALRPLETTSADSAASPASSGGAELRAPLFALTESQSSVISYLLRCWPQAILEEEGLELKALPQGVELVSGTAAASRLRLHDGSIIVLPARAAGSAGSSTTRGSAATSPLAAQPAPPSFLHWVYFHNSLALLDLFLRADSSTVDALVFAHARQPPAPKTQIAEGVLASAAAAVDRAGQPNMISMLHAAAAADDFALVSLLLDRGANPWLPDSHLAHLAVDLASDPAVRALLLRSMDRDARKPSAPAISTRSIETQTLSQWDSVLESARRKLHTKEESLRAEEEKLLAAQLALTQEMQAERMALALQQKKLLAETAAEKEAIQARSEAALAAKQSELLATENRLRVELEAEKARLRDQEAQAIAALESTAREARAQMEQDLRDQSARDHAAQAAALEAAIELERVKLKQKQDEQTRTMLAEAAADRLRLEAVRAELAASSASQLEADSSAVRAKIERECSERSEAALAAETQRLEAEFEAEKQRLREREAEGHAALRAEHARATAALESSMAARAATELAESQARLAQEFEAAKSAIAAREAAGLARLQEERAEERIRSDAALEAERRRLEAEHHSKLLELDRLRLELQAKSDATEAEHRLAREAAAAESAAEFQVNLDREKARMAAEYDARLKRQEAQMSEEVAEARASLAAQRAQWESALEAERASLHADFEVRRAALEMDEAARREAAHEENRARKAAWEHEKAQRALEEQRQREEERARSALNLEEQSRADADRAESFERIERDRALRWEITEKQRATQRALDEAAFLQEKSALALEAEAARARMESTHAARLEHEHKVLEELRAAFEHDRAALQAAAEKMREEHSRDSHEAASKFERARKEAESQRNEERRKDDARLMQERERLRLEMEVSRTALDERLVQERARMELDRSRDAEALLAARRKIEEERSTLSRQRALDAELTRRTLEARDLAHRQEIAEITASWQAKFEAAAAASKAADREAARERKQRLARLEAEAAQAKADLAAQVKEKHAAARLAAHRGQQIALLEASLASLQTTKDSAPLVRITRNPLDVDPLCVGSLTELRGVGSSVASFVSSWQALSFRQLVVLLASMDGPDLAQQAALVLRFYFMSHPHCGGLIDKHTGLWPLHLAARAGLAPALVEIVAREHPAALRSADRGGVHAIMHAAAFRKQREARRAAVPETEAEALAKQQQQLGISPSNGGASSSTQDLSAEALRKQNLDLVRCLALKFPDSIYLPNRLASLLSSPGPADAAAGSPSGSSSSPSSWLTDPLVLSSAVPSGLRSLSVVEYAIHEQDLELLALLLDLTGGDFLAACDSAGRGYLHRAAAGGHFLLVQWLLEVGGVSPWLLCSADRTALEYIDPARSAKGGPDEALALYLTAAMARVPPADRTKVRRGAQRLAIREWTGASAEGDGEGEEAGATAGSSFGGTEMQLLLAPGPTTPRGTPLKPLRHTGRGAALSPSSGGTENGLRSPPSSSFAAHHDAGSASTAAVTASSVPAASPQRSSKSPMTMKQAHTYHWEFLPDRPRHAQVTLRSPTHAAPSTPQARHR